MIHGWCFKHVPVGTHPAMLTAYGAVCQGLRCAGSRQQALKRYRCHLEEPTSQGCSPKTSQGCAECQHRALQRKNTDMDSKPPRQALGQLPLMLVNRALACSSDNNIIVAGMLTAKSQQ